MKRIAIIVVMALTMSLSASASSIRYFTRSQATRTVQHLNAQREMMIYCGYEYEIETYVLINEVWMERINSSYYELWVFGYDAYTGDEIYMPLDLQCVWLYSAGRMYNAAQYLRFHASVRTPTFNWFIPPYNPYTRVMHRSGYVRSYHYDIHRHGWMPPAPPSHGYGPHTQPTLPPYYMRSRHTPAPAPTTTWTPGLEHPQVTPQHNTGTSNGRSGGNVTTGGHSGLEHPQGTTQQSTGTTNSRSGGNVTTGGGRSGGNTTTTTTGTTTTNTRSGGSTTTTTGTPTTNTRSGGNTTTTTTGTTTNTRSTATTPTRTNTGVSSRSGGNTTPTATTGSTTTTNSRSGGNTTTKTTETKPRSTGTTTNTRGGGNTTTGGRSGGNTSTTPRTR